MTDRRPTRFAFTLALALAAGCRNAPAPNPAAGDAGAATQPFVPTITLKLVATRQPGVEGLKGIAVGPDGRFYLACAGGVVVFDAGWSRAADLPTPGAASAVAVHPDGRVFVAERQKVHVFGADGHKLTAWGSPGDKPGQFSFLTGVAVHGPDVWLADAGNRVIHRYDTTGDFVEELGRRDPDAGVPGILAPSPYLDCAVTPDGTLLVGNPGRWQVEHYDRNGRLVARWGKQGAGPDGFPGCCNPTNLVVLPGGNVATAEKGVPRVKVSDPEGKPLAVIGPEHFSTHSAGMDLAVDAEGRLYVVDPPSGNVLVFQEDKTP